MNWYAVAIGSALMLIVSCNEPTEVSISAPLDTLYHFDTTIVHDTTIEFVFDTTIVTVTDTIWCRKNHHRQWVCLDVQPVLED